MDPRRLENEDEEKFWEAWIKDELTFCYRFGKIGSPGGTKLKKFKTAAEAQAELEEKLQQKLAEGFVELGAEKEEEEEADDEEADDDEADDEEADDDEADDDEADDDGADEADDDEADEADDDEADDDEADDDEDEKPNKRKKRSEPPPPPPPPPRPTLPSRVHSRAHAPTSEELASTVERVIALSKALGGRSWRVTHRARALARSLAHLGGIDPAASPTLAAEFAGLMADVIAPKKRLPLDAALRLLWEIDASAAQKVVTGWRAKMLVSPASASVGVLAATFEAVPDPEVALHTAVALVERHLATDAWARRFAKVVPFLEESLETKGTTVAKFLASLRPEGDVIVKARVLAAGTVKGSVTLPLREGATVAATARKRTKR